MIINIDGFKEKEFYCKCDNSTCNKKLHMFEDNLLAARLRFIAGELHKLRIIIKTSTGAEDVKIIITSGARCIEHNSQVGGVPASKHLLCKATDFYVVVNGERYTHEKLFKIIKIYSFMLAINHIEKTTHGEATHITWEVPS